MPTLADRGLRLSALRNEKFRGLRLVAQHPPRSWVGIDRGSRMRFCLEVST